MKIHPLFIILFAIGLTGCSTTTCTSRKSAAATRQLVTNFRNLEQKRLDDINANYRQEFGKLMSEMTQLTWKETEQGFDRQSVLLADKLAGDWSGQTQPGAISGTLLQIVQQDYSQLTNSESELDQLRSTYVDQYKNVAAQLDQLKQIEANLDALSKTQTQWNNDQAVLGMLYQAYRDTQNASATNAVPKR